MSVTVPELPPSWLVKRAAPCPPTTLTTPLLFNDTRHIGPLPLLLTMSTPLSLTCSYVPLCKPVVSLRTEMIYVVLLRAAHSWVVSIASVGCTSFGFILQGFLFFCPPSMWFSLAGLPFLSITPPVPCGCCGGAEAGLGGFTFQPRRYANPP